MTACHELSLLVLAAVFTSTLGCAAGGNDPSSAVWQTVTAITWRVDSLQGNPPIPETNILLILESDGGMSGHTGANRYFGSYGQTDDGGLTISLMGVTRVYRAQPDGVMDQESAYLSLLQEVNGYRTEAGRLLMLVGDRVVLEFVPSDPA